MSEQLSPEDRLHAAGATLVAFNGGLRDDPAGGKPWPAPKALTTPLPCVEKMRKELLPSALAGYVFDVAERQQSPADFSAVAALCGLAAVVGNRVRIAPKTNDDWTVVPNLWGAIVGRPSAMKSPAMTSALGALYALQDDRRKAWEADQREKRVEESLATLDAKDAKKQAAKALKAGDREAAKKLIADLDGPGGESEPAPRLVVNDATVEKLGELLNENPRGLLLVRDELPGFLARMESEEYQSERAFYLEAFNGDGRFTYDRIGRGTVHIANCTLSLIGGVQPSRIAPIVRGAITGATNDGLIQRLQLAVWPDDRKEWVWVDRHSNKTEREAFERVFFELDDNVPGSSAEPAVLRFAPSAQERFRAWMTGIQAEARSGTLSSVMESHLLKMPATIASLALLFELIDGGRFEVGEVATDRALKWATYLRSHAERLYAAGSTMADDGARLILERRSQLPAEFSVRDVQRKAWASLGDRDAVFAALDVLLMSNHCREVQMPATATGGRPTAVYQWNPVLVV